MSRPLVWSIRLAVVVVLAVALRWCLWQDTPRPAAEQVRPVAHLGAWGVTEEGRVWGVVALPRGWHKGDTILLLTVNAKMERKP